MPLRSEATPSDSCAQAFAFNSVKAVPPTTVVLPKEQGTKY